MSYSENIRYIGIVADAETDQKIIAKFAQCLLENDSCKIEKLFLKDDIIEFMDNFRRTAKTEGYGLDDNPAKKLREGIVLFLMRAVKEFRDKIPRELGNSDLLILNTDAELSLKDADNYFSAPFINIHYIFSTAIEQFYQKMAQWDFDIEHLPLIMPLVLFPSTDILVAVAKSDFSFRNMKPSELKKKLYNTDNLAHLTPEKFEKSALDVITVKSFNSVYKHIPETRNLFRTLLWAN